MNLRRIALLAIATAACGEGKLPDVAIDYGPEDAPFSDKDDSATRPSSMARLRLGAALRTTFTAAARWRAFKLAATAGEKLDIYVDGLRGLDTVAYVYNVSATTGRPYGRPIASNDDTDSLEWTSNEYSSSILGFVPRYTRDYAVVVTTYRQSGRGTASVVVRGAPAAAFVAGGSGRFVDLEGVRAEVMNLAPQIAELLRATPSEYSLLADAFRVDPAALGDPGAVAGAAFSYALDITDWLRSGDFAIDGIPPQQIGTTLADRLRFHSGNSGSDAAWATARANFERIGAAMIADGVTDAFTVRMEESGDYSYFAVAAVNAQAGSVRLAGFRRDP